MNFATNDILFNAKRRKPGAFLHGSQKRSYLRRMRRIVSRYKRELRDKQYYVSQRTLGLPSSRYRPYVAQASQPHVEGPAVHTSINTHYEPFARDSFEFASIEKNCTIFPNYTPLFVNPRMERRSRRIRSGSKYVRRVRKRRRAPRSRFAGLWGNVIDRVQVNEVPGMVNDVLALIDDEMKGHVGSRGQRDKMFHGGHDGSSLYTAIDIDGVATQLGSREANILFGSIRDAATRDTMKLGWWNPDVYEKNLERYAAKLKAFKEESCQMIQQLKDDLQSRAFGLIEEFQQPFKGFIEKISYNELPATL